MNRRSTFGFRKPAKALALALSLQLTGVMASGQSLPTALTIVTLDGEGATGPVRQRPGKVPSIRVVDEKEKPVSGASVVFTLPTEGATGVFADGGKTLITMTDAQGMASAQGMRFNQIPGKVPVNVNVSYKGLTARTSIVQISVAPAGYKPGGGGHSGLIAVLVVLAGGAAGGAVYALRSKNGSSSPTAPAVVPPTPIGITAGSGTLTPPH